MTKTTGTILTLTALLLVACEHGNQAPGALPPMGSYTSPSTGTSACADPASNCAIVPDPYGVIGKKPEDKSPPTIVVPDYKDAIIPAAPGNAVSFLIQTSHATSIAADCVPVSTVSISANSSTIDSQIFFLGKMPNQDVSCTLTATGPNGSASTKVTLHPQAGIGANKPVFKGIPDSMAIKHGTSQTVAKITLNNLAPNAKPATVSCKYNKPSLAQTEDGSYTFSIMQSQSPGVVDLCTFLAVNPDGEFGTFVASITSTPTDPLIVPTNFKTTAPLLLGFKKIGCISSTSYAYVDEACQVFPRFTIINPDQVDIGQPKLSCTGVDFIPTQPFIPDGEKNIVYQANIEYKPTSKSTTETCTLSLEITDTDYPGKVELSFPVQFPAPPPPPPAPTFKTTATHEIIPGIITGFAFQTTDTDDLSFVCAPAIVSITKTNVNAYYLKLSNAMPKENVVCDLTATGPGGVTSFKLTLKPGY